MPITFPNVPQGDSDGYTIGGTGGCYKFVPFCPINARWVNVVNVADFCSEDSIVLRTWQPVVNTYELRTVLFSEGTME